MTCSGAYATADEFTQQWFWDFDADDKTEITPLLIKSAGRIHAAMAAQGMCDCTLASWANDYLAELNMGLAAVLFNTPCVRLSNEQRRIINDNANSELDKIRKGEIELCAGQTAKGYPAFGIAQYANTDRQAARIIERRFNMEQ